MTTSRRTFLRNVCLGTLGLCWAPARGESPLAKLVRSTPEAEGVSSAGILAFLEEMEATNHELHSFMMLRHGKVVAEGWWDPYAADLHHTMYSMSKSFTSTAVGLAVSEGKLSVEDKVISFFPDELPATVSENLAKLKVKHLLTMSVGNEKEPTGEVVKSENWVRTFLAQNISHEPGTVFLYNSAATYMCSAIVQKLTGQTVLDYLTPRLFAPLGVSGMTWENCPRGINTGGWGLSITTETMAKFGQLYLQKGQWNGKQVLPTAWVEEATTFKIQQPARKGTKRPKETDDWQQGYGYQFWRSQHGAFRGDGAFGQFTIVLPEQEAVVIMTSETKDMQGQLDLVWKHLLPAMTKTEASSALATRLRSLALPVPKSEGDAAWIRQIQDKPFKLEANDLGLTELSFHHSDGGLRLEIKTAKATHYVNHGSLNWLRGTAAIPGTPPRLIAGGKPAQTPKSKIAAAFASKPGRTLELVWRYYETPHHDRVTCVFDGAGKQVEVTFVNSLAAMSGAKKDARPMLKGTASA